MTAIFRTVGALATLFILSACFVTPGEFTSTLDIRADRSFAFTYVGEILVEDIPDMGLPAEDSDSGPANGNSALRKPIAGKKSDPATASPFLQKNDGDTRKMEAIATALMKEKGFKSARYLGDKKFSIEYAINGVLNHSFIFPFNPDARILLPFVTLELRGADRVRVKAPGFSVGFDQSKTPGLGGRSDESVQALNGRFTLTTNAEIISQNQEDGAAEQPSGKMITWLITPETTEAPSATLRFE